MKGMNHIKQIHAHTLRRNIDQTHFLILKLLSIPNLQYARRLLPIPPPIFLANKLLQTYYKTSAPIHRSLSLYSLLLLSSAPHLRPNRHSFTFLFASCSAHSLPLHGRALHAHLLLSGLPPDPFISTSLLNLYSNSNLLSDARNLFDQLPSRHRDLPVWNSLLSAYSRAGDLANARLLFNSMPDRNVISWTSMVSGYSHNQMYDHAIDMFVRMCEQGGEVRPNAVTLASVLPACANLGELELGEKIEAYARANGLVNNLFVSNALVEMYAKCGSIDRARRMFEEMGVRRNLCSWNSMIMGLAVHGRWEEGLELFREMAARGIAPDGITFVGVLLACTHGGLVDRGREFFRSMDREFSVKPRLEHYGCMVDLLGRAGLLSEAYSLITSMPMKPDSVIWGALLGACSFHGEVELAERAAGYLSELEPWNPGNHVILSNIYASSGRWDGVAKEWKLMRGKQQKKVAGYSFIELDGNMYKFLVEDKSHPRSKEIYTMLDEVTYIMRLLDDLPNSDCQFES